MIKWFVMFACKRPESPNKQFLDYVKWKGKSFVCLKKLACYQNLLFAYQVKTGDKSSSPITIWETKKNLMWQQKQPPFNSCSRWVPAQTELSCFRGYGIYPFSFLISHQMQVHRFFICLDATGKPHVCLAWSMWTTSNFKVYNSQFSHVL